ncbi:hypothetical protein Hanom_Chr12g01160911 [Helianthus anomalus]
MGVMIEAQVMQTFANGKVVRRRLQWGMKLRGNYGQKYVILKCLREEYGVIN